MATPVLPYDCNMMLWMLREVQEETGKLWVRARGEGGVIWCIVTVNQAPP